MFLGGWGEGEGEGEEREESDLTVGLCFFLGMLEMWWCRVCGVEQKKTHDCTFWKN